MDTGDKGTKEIDNIDVSWQTVRRKRTASTSPSTLRTNTKNLENRTVSTKNRYELLNVPDSLVAARDTQGTSEGSQTNTKEPKTIRPPPIFIHGVVNYSGMVNTLTRFVKEEQLSLTVLSNNVVRVNLISADDYRQLVRELRKLEISFHTYQMKTERALKVVIRQLHPSTPTAEIKEALSELGFQCRNVANIRHWQTKTPLPLFFVDIEPDEHASEIYNVTNILHSRVKIESPRPKRTIVQCHRCQQLGHTKTYCTLPPVCVKCGGDHTWESCKKPRDDKPTCGLCQGDHTANYRGCPNHKKFTATRQTVKNSRNLKPNSTDPTSGVGPSNAQTAPNNLKSYAQALNPAALSTATNESSNDTELIACFKKLEQLMADLIRQNGMILELLLRSKPK